MRYAEEGILRQKLHLQPGLRGWEERDHISVGGGAAIHAASSKGYRATVPRWRGDTLQGRAGRNAGRLYQHDKSHNMAVGWSKVSVDG